MIAFALQHPLSRTRHLLQIESGIHKARYWPQEAAKAVQKRSSAMDGQLFLIKQLLILREQIAPFEADFSVIEKDLDFSHMRDHLRRIMAGESLPCTPCEACWLHSFPKCMLRLVNMTQHWECSFCAFRKCAYVQGKRHYSQYQQTMPWCNSSVEGHREFWRVRYNFLLNPSMSF